MYDRFFWAGCRIGLRRNTCADRLKLIVYFNWWPAQTAAIFFWGMLKPILKLPIWISSVAQARFQQLIFYCLPDRILVFPPPIFRSGVLGQGSDKFYSVSFQARHSFFASLLTRRSPES
jgi:hypothetical protein